MLLQAHEQLEEKIVRYLARHPARTVLELQRAVRNRGASYTLQAFYKQLAQLESAGVVSRAKARYSLRLPWVHAFLHLAATAGEHYVDSPPLDDILPTSGRQRAWRFTDLHKLNNFWSQILFVLFAHSGEKLLLAWIPHPWFHLAETEQEEQYVQSLERAEIRLYQILGARTYLDRWAERFWQLPNIHYSFAPGPFAGEPAYMNVVGDYVLTVSLDAETRERIEELYRNARRAEDVDLGALLRIFRLRTDARMRLERNPKKAASIRRKFRGYFGTLDRSAQPLY